MRVANLRVGDVLVNAYGETVNLIVEITPETYAWVCLFGPPHFVVGVVMTTDYKPDTQLHAIWDLYRGGRFFLNEVETQNAETLERLTSSL